MGEVYHARDTDLGREVAIKTSAQRFSERFEREASSFPLSTTPISVRCSTSARTTW